MTDKISDKDKKDWENFLRSTDKLEIKDKEEITKSEFLIGKSIDLHGYSLQEANHKIFEFLAKIIILHPSSSKTQKFKKSRPEILKNPKNNQNFIKNPKINQNLTKKYKNSSKFHKKSGTALFVRVSSLHLGLYGISQMMG